jgi:glycosyltransferase involved in cell wall biosynthesis
MYLSLLTASRDKPVLNCGAKEAAARAPHIVVGVTSSQTCLVLTGRLRALRESGFRITLISSPGAILERLSLAEGVDAVAIPQKRVVAPLADLLSLLRLWRVLLNLRPDIVEFSTPKAGLLGMLAATFARIPRRVYLLRGLKLESQRGLKRLVLQAGESTAAACAHIVLCNSPSLREQAIALHLAPEEKLQILGSGSSKGVDVERFYSGPTSLRERFGIPADAHVLGFVGRFTRDKGIPALIDAFDLILKTAPRAYLLMVGWFDKAEDAITPELRRRIASHPRIVCTGFVADAAPYYRAMDLLILPTLREGFPNVVLEASASGIPVLTTNATGARDSIAPGETGLLVCSDAASISQTTLKLLSDPELCRCMGTAGRRRAAEQFLDRRIFSLTTAFYRELLQRGAIEDRSKAKSMDLAVPLP